MLKTHIYNKVGLLKAVILWIFMLPYGFLSAQVDYANKFAINTEFGFTGLLEKVENFSTFTLNSTFQINNIGLTPERNYSFSYTRTFGRVHGISASLGFSNYGFFYEGKIPESSAPNRIIKANYDIRFIEWGLSYSIKIKRFKFGNIQSEIGIRYNTDSWGTGGFSPTSILISHKEALGLSGYLGYEIPMLSDNFFASFGFTFKIPLQRFDYDYENITKDKYRPYFIGTKVSINYQF